MNSIWGIIAVVAMSGAFCLVAFVLGALAYRLGSMENKQKDNAAPVSAIPDIPPIVSPERKAEREAKKAQAEFEENLERFERMLNE